MTKVVKGAGRNRYTATKARNDQRGELPPRGGYVYTGAEHTTELAHAAHNCHAYGAHDHAADGSPVPVGRGVKWCARCSHTRAAHFSGEDCVKCDECPAFLSSVKLYHASPESNVVDILREGLVGGAGYDPVHLTEVGPETRCPTSFDARDFIANLFAVRVEDVVLFEVEVAGLCLVEGWDGEGTWAYDGTIPPERLRLLEESSGEE